MRIGRDLSRRSGMNMGAGGAVKTSAVDRSDRGADRRLRSGNDGGDDLGRGLQAGPTGADMDSMGRVGQPDDGAKLGVSMRAVAGFEPRKAVV